MSDRVDIGSIRRAQIVEAACRVINRKGIQNASLAEIEQEAGISRGLLTYHFPSKESIILAVFDATIDKMKERARARHGTDRTGWGRLEGVLEFLLTQKPRDDEFDCLHYTFLAQMSHREDFRERLAAEYAEGRKHIATDIDDLARQGGVGPEDAKALVAIIHAALTGLIMQINVDPGAIDREGVLRAFKSMILGFMDRDGTRSAPRRGRAVRKRRSESVDG
jgi:AcrR family transcriptional regulator